MTPHIFLALGVALLLCALVAVRTREGSWWSPATILLLVFFINIFLDPLLRYYGLRPSENDAVRDTWVAFSAFNAACYAALVAGYALPRTGLRRDWQFYREARPGPIFDRAGFFLVVGICVAILLLTFIAMAYWGRFGLVKHAFEDVKPAGFELITSLYAVVFMFVPALFVSAYLGRPEAARWQRWIVWGVVALVVALSLALFDRGTALTIVLTIGLLYHFRFRSFTWWQVVLGLLFVAFVVSFTLLRRTDTGIANINPAAVLALVDAGRLAARDLFIIGVTMFEGQDVLANVINLTQDTGLFHGRTYLNTLLTQFYDTGLEIPKHWYRTISGHAPGSHGRGFGLAAEAYMNFGRLGFLVFFLVGLLARWASFKIYTARNPVLLIWSAYALTALIYALRSDSYTLFAQLVLHVIPLLLFWALGAKFTRSVDPAAAAPIRRPSPTG